MRINGRVLLRSPSAKENVDKSGMFTVALDQLSCSLYVLYQRLPDNVLEREAMNRPIP